MKDGTDAYTLTFCFKGNRNYIQGADIYDKINKFIIRELGIHDIRKINMSVHKFINGNLFLELHKNKEIDRREDTAVVFSFTHDSDKYKLLLSENNEPVHCRYEYNEEEITENCEVDIENKKVTLGSLTGFTVAEVVTAMNKFLLNFIYPEIKGKWLFTGFQADKYEEKSDFSSLEVELKHNFNFKLTKSSIKTDGRETGFIYFSLI